MKEKDEIKLARGKKTEPEAIYKIMSLWAITENYTEVSKQLGVAKSTVKKIVEEHKNDPEFEQLCTQKKETFSEKADKIIDLALQRLKERLEADNNAPLNHLTTVIGTLYDKKALAEGKTTENTKITFELPQELKKYAE